MGLPDIVVEKKVHILQYVWNGAESRYTEENRDVIPIYRRQFVSATNFIKENGAKIPLPEKPKYIIQDDDFLLEGYFFRLNNESQIVSGGGPRFIDIMVEDIEGQRHHLSKLLEKLDLPLA